MKILCIDEAACKNVVQRQRPSQRWPLIVPRSEVATQPQSSTFHDTHLQIIDNNHKDNAHPIIGSIEVLHNRHMRFKDVAAIYRADRA
jgi:hypothetical protein